MKPIIPSLPHWRTRRRFDKQLYRIRYRIEWHFHWLERFRRILTRHEEESASLLAIVHLADMLAWLQ